MFEDFAKTIKNILSLKPLSFSC